MLTVFFVESLMIPPKAILFSHSGKYNIDKSRPSAVSNTTILKIAVFDVVSPSSLKHFQTTSL